MDKFIVQYKDTTIEFSKVEGGWAYKCPHPEHPKNSNGGQAYNWIDTESGKRHKISFEGDKATVIGSLGCVHDCPGHFMLENGVLRDC